MRIVLLMAFVLMFSMSIATASPDKPIIGITVDVRERDGSESISVTTRAFDAVTTAGGIPVLLPPVLTLDDIPRYVELVDGFLFTGGSDIDPARYGRDMHEKTRLVNFRRENFDLALMRAVLDSHKPVLAICLGMQEMNVACGGTLIQDIPSETNSTLTHSGRDAGHDVTIENDSKLFAIMGGAAFPVNSSHHQSVEQPGKGLVVTAHAPDGIIEGIEMPDRPFAIGVQWHPERMTGLAPQKRLFESLVKAAVEHKAAIGAAEFHKQAR